MSRRNSATRRRSYGRRLHEIHERRGNNFGGTSDWLADLDDAGTTGWQHGGGRDGQLDEGALRDSRGRAA